MSNIVININVQSEGASKPVNKFYPYLVYVSRPDYKQPLKRLENTIKEMQSVNAVHEKML